MEENEIKNLLSNEFKHLSERALSAHNKSGRTSAKRRKKKTSEIKKMILDADSHPCPSCGTKMHCPEPGTVCAVLTHPNMPIGDHIVMLSLDGDDDISNIWVCCNVCDKARGYTYNDRKASLSDAEVKEFVIWSVLQADQARQSLAAELYPEHHVYFEKKRKQILDQIEPKGGSPI